MFCLLLSGRELLTTLLTPSRVEGDEIRLVFVVAVVCVLLHMALKTEGVEEASLTH